MRIDTNPFIQGILYICTSFTGIESSRDLSHTSSKIKGELFMKKLLVMFSITFLAVIGMNAQTSFEIQAGADFAKMVNPTTLVPGAVWASRIGSIGGVSAEFGLSRALSLAPGLRFNQKGLIADFTFFNYGPIHTNLTQNYLEIPLYLRYRITDFGPQLYILGGPSIGYLLSAPSNTNMQSQDLSTMDVKADYTKFDSALELGISTRMPISQQLGVSITALYSYGLVKIDKRDDAVTHRGITITGGLSYELQ
jgi:hypothetical protein